MYLTQVVSKNPNFGVSILMLKTFGPSDYVVFNKKSWHACWRHWQPSFGMQEVRPVGISPFYNNIR